MYWRRAFDKHSRLSRKWTTIRRVKVLIASNLVLEPQGAAHAGEMFAVLSDRAIYEFENAPPVSEAWLRERFSKLEARHSPDGKEQWLNWVIRLPSGKLAGYVQATVTMDGKAHVAYELASAYWGQGVGSRAVTIMLAHLARDYAVTEFFATLKVANHRSLKLLTRNGFAPASISQTDGWSIESDERVMYRAPDQLAGAG